MLSPSKPCSSSCEENLHPRLFLCGRCRQQVRICRRCDRGQVYCGRDCALVERRSRQREARRRYQTSEHGRRIHANRSRKYRARDRRVTDQGPILETKPVQQPEPAQATTITARPANIIAGMRATVCHRCGQPISDLVRMAPIRRPHRRRINPFTDRPAPRHQQIITDPDRR
jgi:hypothetical protein